MRWTQFGACAAALAIGLAAGSARASAFAATSSSGASVNFDAIHSSNHAGTITKSTGDGVASASVTFNPAPGVSAAALALGESIVSADAMVDYDVIVHGLTFSEDLQEVPLLLSGLTKLSSSSFGSATGKITDFTGGFLPTQPFQSTVTSFVCGPNGRSGCGRRPFTLGVDAFVLNDSLFLAEIKLEVDATAQESPDDAFAMIDPIISIDPDFLALHPGAYLEISPGIGNGDTLPSGAPEPAAWALMLCGFGLAGAALRRRWMAT